MNFEYKMVIMGVLLFAVGVPLILKLVLPNSVVRSVGINLVMAGLTIVVTALVVPRLIPDYSRERWNADHWDNRDFRSQPSCSQNPAASLPAVVTSGG